MTPYCACDAAEVGAEPGEDFVHDEDDAVLVAARSQQLQESRLRRDAAGVVMDWLADTRPRAHRHARPCARSNASTSFQGAITTSSAPDSGTPPDEGTTALAVVEWIGAPVEPRLGETVEMAVELQVLPAAGGVAGDAQRDQRHLAADAGEADALGGRDDLDQRAPPAARGTASRRRR